MVQGRPNFVLFNVGPFPGGPNRSSVHIGNRIYLPDDDISPAVYRGQCLSGRLLRRMSLQRQVLSRCIRYIPWKSSLGCFLQEPDFHTRVLQNQRQLRRNLPSGYYSIPSLLARSIELGLPCRFPASGGVTRRDILPCHVP